MKGNKEPSSSHEADDSYREDLDAPIGYALVSGDMLAELRKLDQDRRAWALHEARSILREGPNTMAAGPCPPRDDLLVVAEYILDGTLPYEYAYQEGQQS
jgi:hypothetical protein